MANQHEKFGACAEALVPTGAGISRGREPVHAAYAYGQYRTFGSQVWHSRCYLRGYAGALPARIARGYRVYSGEDLGRLWSVQRTKRLGLLLAKIRRLVGTVQAGECIPLRHKIAAIGVKLAAPAALRISKPKPKPTGLLDFGAKVVAKP